MGCKLFLQLWGRVLEEFPLPLSPSLCQPELIRKAGATAAQRGDTGQQSWGTLSQMLQLQLHVIHFFFFSFWSKSALNNRWFHAGRVTVKCSFGNLDTELIAIGFCPYNLLRVFSSVILVTTYIPPSALAKTACDAISSVVAKLQTQNPYAFVSCSNRGNKISDLFYTYLSGLYLSDASSQSSFPLLRIGIPCYKDIYNRREPREGDCGKLKKLCRIVFRLQKDAFCHLHVDEIKNMSGFLTDHIHFPPEEWDVSPETHSWPEGSSKQEKKVFWQGDGFYCKVYRSKSNLRLETARSTTGRSWKTGSSNNIWDVWSEIPGGLIQVKPMN